MKIRMTLTALALALAGSAVHATPAQCLSETSAYAQADAAYSEAYQALRRVERLANTGNAPDAPSAIDLRGQIAQLQSQIGALEEALGPDYAQRVAAWAATLAAENKALNRYRYGPVAAARARYERLHTDPQLQRLPDAQREATIEAARQEWLRMVADWRSQQEAHAAQGLALKAERDKIAQLGEFKKQLRALNAQLAALPPAEDEESAGQTLTLEELRALVTQKRRDRQLAQAALWQCQGGRHPSARNR